MKKEIRFRDYLEAESTDQPLDETGDQPETADAADENSAPEPLKETDTTESSKSGPSFKHGQKVKFMVEGTIKKSYDLAQAGEFSYLVEVTERKGSHEYLVTERGLKLVDSK